MIVAAAVAVAIVGEVAREINAAADDESKLTLNCERATQLDAGAETEAGHDGGGLNLLLSQPARLG